MAWSKTPSPLFVIRKPRDSRVVQKRLTGKKIKNRGLREIEKSVFVGTGVLDCPKSKEQKQSVVERIVITL